MLKNKHWLEVDEESVEVEIGDENQASRDSHEFGHTGGKRVIQKDKTRVPRFKSKQDYLMVKGPLHIKNTKRERKKVMLLENMIVGVYLWRLQ